MRSKKINNGSGRRVSEKITANDNEGNTDTDVGNGEDKAGDVIANDANDVDDKDYLSFLWY